MVIPEPLMRRRAVLLIIDDQRRLLLCKTCHGEWTPPQASLRVAAVQRCLRAHIGSIDYRVERLRGSFWPEVPTGERLPREAAHVLIVRPRGRLAPMDPDRHVLWGVEASDQRSRLPVRPRLAATVAAGYLEGWLPDCAIRLG